MENVTSRGGEAQGSNRKDFREQQGSDISPDPCRSRVFVGLVVGSCGNCSCSDRKGLKATKSRTRPEGVRGIYTISSWSPCLNTSLYPTHTSWILLTVNLLASPPSVYGLRARIKKHRFDSHSRPSVPICSGRHSRQTLILSRRIQVHHCRASTSAASPPV